MSKSIEELAKQLKSMPKPTGEPAGRMWDSGNCYCDALRYGIDNAVSGDRPTSERLKTIMEAGFGVEIMAYMQDKVDERVRILRAMYLTAIAIIQGKPEPSDAEIAAMQSAPLMDESKIPDPFRKAKATQKREGATVSVPADRQQVTGGIGAGSSPPRGTKPWWKIW
jgi:hypothetical protein